MDSVVKVNVDSVVKVLLFPHSAVFGAHVWIEYKQGTSREFLEHFIAHVI